jgi:ADP-ribose pyrophosphatase
VTIFEATGLSEIEDFEPDAEERIEIVKWPLDDLDGAIEACHDSKSLIALHMLRATRA